MVGVTKPGDLTVSDILTVYDNASTKPCLVRTEDGAKWVMKLAGAGQGPAGLMWEFIGLGVARAFRVPVPEARIIHLPEGFPWQVGTDEYDEMLQRSFGPNLAIAYVEEAEALTAAEALELPQTLVDHIAAADAWLCNVDRTHRNTNLLRAPDGTIHVIDYGACLFGPRALARRYAAPSLPAHHLFQARAQNPVSRPAFDWEAMIAPLPSAWLASIGLDHTSLLERLRAAEEAVGAMAARR